MRPGLRTAEGSKLSFRFFVSTIRPDSSGSKTSVLMRVALDALNKVACPPVAFKLLRMAVCEALSCSATLSQIRPPAQSK